MVFFLLFIFSDCMLSLHIITFPGADPGEVKWVNFHPPFSEHVLSFFSYPSNIDLKHLNQALVLLYYYKYSPPISKSCIRACFPQGYVGALRSTINKTKHQILIKHKFV